MKNKTSTWIGINLCVLLLAVAGCKLFGANPAPPTKIEANAFDIATNVVTQVVTRTNTVTTTNIVNVPTSIGVPFYQTNFVTTTNVVTSTNQVEQYQYTPKPATVETVTQLGTAVAPFTAGWGSIISGALVGLYGLWAHLRSTKKGATNVVLTQDIEAIRDFILTLPQGSQIDTAVTQFMQQHQVEAGVAKEVMSLIEGNTTNPTVVGISKTLQDAIDELTNPPVVAPK